MKKLSKKQIAEYTALDGVRVSIPAVLVGNVWYENEGEWNKFRGTYGYPDMDWRPTHMISWTWKFFQSWDTNHGELYRKNVTTTLI